MARNRFVLPALVLVAGVAVAVPVSAAAPDVTLARSSATTMSVDFTHSAFIDAAGEVWASGYQAFGALGNGVVSSSAADDPVRAALPGGVKAVKVDVGGDATIVVGDDGVLYGTGRNDGHQLSGTGDRSTLTPFAWNAAVTVPSVVDASIADYSSGGSTIVAGSDGTIYQTGNVVASATNLTPFAYELPAGAGRPVKVVAGHGDYLVVTDLGKLYGFGANDASRLTSSWQANTWVPLDTSGSVVAAVAGTDHTAWLLSNGQVKAVGSDAQGQLGTGAGDGSTVVPVTVPGTWAAIAGNADQRTVLVDAAGGVSIAGRQPDFSTLQDPTAVASSGGSYVAREVAAGEGALMMRTPAGDVWGAGQQNFAQLRSGAGNPLLTWRRQDDQPVRATGPIAPLEPVRVGQELTARSGAWVPTTAALTYEWRVGSTLLASGADYTPSLADQELQQAAGQPLVLTVSAAGTDLTARSEATVLGPIDDGLFTSATTPTIAGTTGVGRLLRSSIPTSAPASTVTYEWLRDGVAIAGVAGREYRQSAADAGRALTVRATFSTPGYATVQRLADVREVPAYNSARPTFSGTLTVGRKLSAKKGTWSGYKYAYAPFWYRNGVRIAGATGWSYRLTTKDKGKNVAVRIYAKRTGWPTVFATSSAKKVAK